MQRAYRTRSAEARSPPVLAYLPDDMQDSSCAHTPQPGGSAARVSRLHLIFTQLKSLPSAVTK
jgi:hypothetical protein